MLSCELKDNVLTLGGDLQIHYLETLHELAADLTNDEAPLTIDVSDVRELDLSGLQYLLSLIKSRGESSPTLIRGAGPAMKRALVLTGLEPYFKDNME